MTKVTIILNGEPASAEIEPRTHLADLLREHVRANGTHLGCEHGVCGSCTVLLNGVPVRSCITLAIACEGAAVRSIEGFEDDVVMEFLRAAFSREHALQCGFCTPGMLIAARDIVLRLPEADEARIRRELAGNLCRCTGYVGIIKAVQATVQQQHKLKPVSGPAAVDAVTPFKTFSTSWDQARPGASAAPVLATAAASNDGAADTPSQSKQGWTLFEDNFVIRRPASEVWEVLGNLPMIVSCLPGAELIKHDGPQAQGRMTVRLGPINAAFSGSAVIARDDAAMSGSVRGAGSDEGSRSRTKAFATYRVTPNAGGTDAVVILRVEYNLQGPLAQFSRSNIAQELGRRLIGEFASNLNERLQHPYIDAPPRSATLNANALIWATLSRKLRRFIARLTGGHKEP